MLKLFEKDQYFILIYQGSREKFTAEIFLRNCDNKGRIFTVIFAKESKKIF